jgi:hypothetical protein
MRLFGQFMMCGEFRDPLVTCLVILISLEWLKGHGWAVKLIRHGLGTRPQHLIYNRKESAKLRSKQRFQFTTNEHKRLIYPTGPMDPQGLTFELLPSDVRQDTAIGAEIKLPEGMPILDLERLSAEDKQTLRKALFENQVIVIRGQKGIDATVLPELAKVFDESAIGIHSAGEKAVSDPRNILSAYKAGRIPRAPQVGIIGSGKFQDYEGLPELEVIHLVKKSLAQWIVLTVGLTSILGPHLVP